MPSAEKQWAYLCKKFHAKHRALSDCLPELFQQGVLSSEHLADYRRLNTEVEEVRKRMDELITSVLIVTDASLSAAGVPIRQR
jgi:hypothetical protein